MIATEMPVSGATFASIVLVAFFVLAGVLGLAEVVVRFFRGPRPEPPF